MSIEGNKEQLRQPMVVVAALLFVGVFAGWWLLSMGFVGPLMLFYGAMAFVVALAFVALWRDRSTLLMTMIVGCGVAVVSLSTHRNGDIYERSSMRYFVENRGDAQGASYTDYRYVAPQGWSAKANVWCYERLELLGLDEGDFGLLSAMLLGRKGAIDGALRVSYARSGAAHLLAISGLHLGVIFFLVNLFLLLLNLFWRGHLWRNLLVVAIIWGYVVVVGASASVVRAAIMFSVLQLALFMSRSYSSMNGLATAAVAMVLFDPKSIFDVGFLLSVSAVGAILLWALPLWNVVRGECRGFFQRFDRFGVAQFVLLSLLIGLACSVATAPLVGLAFGYVAFWGVLLSPLVTATVAVVLTLAILWIFFGWAFAAPFFRWGIEGALWVQNWSVGAMSSGWRDAVDVDLGVAWVAVAYLVMALVTILFRWWLVGYYERRNLRWHDTLELSWRNYDDDWDDL